MFEVDGGDLYGQGAVARHGDIAGLLADDDADRIRDLTHTEGGTVTESETLGYVHVMAHRENTTHRLYPMIGDDHRSVVQR